jgi:PAS domain S-box-containing protein
LEHDEDRRLFEALEATAGLSGLSVLVTTTEMETPRVLYLSPGIEELLGRSIDEIRENGVWAFIAEDELPRLLQAQKIRLEGDTTPRFRETVVVRSDGERVPVEMFSSVTQLEQGRVTVSFIRDITGRKQVEERLRQSEERFRTLIENAPDGIAIARGKTIIYLNPVAARLLGANDPALALGKSVADFFVGPGDHELLDRRIDHLERTGSAPDQIAIYHSRDVDGRNRTLEVASIPVDYTGEPALLVFARDVTERVLLQEKLVESEQSFRSLVENAPDAIAILQDMKIVFLNPAAASLAGLEDPDRAVGLPVTAFLRPEFLEYASQRIDHVKRTGALHDSPGLYGSRDIDGRDRILEVLSMFIDYRGEPAILVFARDVTERLEMQAKLAQSDRLAALGVLAGGIAHEINNPLAYAKLNLNRALRKLAELSGGEGSGADLGEIPAILAIAAEGVERAGEIVRDIQSFARPAPNVEAPLDIVVAMERALGMAAYAIGRKATVARKFEEGIPGINGNAARVEQLFLNLLINAAQAFDGDGAEDNRVTVSLSRADVGGVRVEIADNGRGMSAVEADRAFDPFYTADSYGTGTGLGLSICKTIVEEMGGQIELSSRRGEGTTFRITLPADDR